MEFFKKDFGVEVKENKTIVTDADKESHRILVKMLGLHGWPILSEEGKDDMERMKSDIVWVVDPLDGTQEFFQGMKDFSVMVALVKGGVPVLGVCHHPAHKTYYCASLGFGAYQVFDGEMKRIYASNRKEKSEAKLIASRMHYEGMVDDFASLFGDLSVHRVGGAGIKITRIAEGSADVFFNPTGKMGEWDVCAPSIILKEAGGELTDINGEEIVFNKEEPNVLKGVLATNGFLHKDALLAIKESLK